ncbi:2'-5' RNA ligase family protein [Candidatus Gracilibacteria bacterium]|nr:2'-5' RNA ligase family protein [Candidatus Gracilibacteria bacterium]
MERISEQLKCLSPKAHKFWISPQKMHITLALPGRKGEHFQANGVAFMKKQIEEAIQNISVFKVELGNLNCFPDVIFREVLDPTGMLQALHNDICKRIPFTQKPEYQFDNFIPHLSFAMGEGDKNIFAHKDFSRELPITPMKIERIFLGKAKNEEGEYESRILHEFILH